MNDDKKSTVAKLCVTVNFTVNVYDLADYEANNIAELTANMRRWYEDGSCDVYGDMASSESLIIAVAVCNELDASDTVSL